MHLEEKKKLIVNSMKVLLEKKMNLGSEGNVSLRHQKGFLISPSAIPTKNLNKKAIVFFENRTSIGQFKPSSEWKFHELIYSNNKNVNAIVHAHSNWATIVSCLRKNIPAFHYMVAEIGGDNIKCSKYALFGTDEIAKNILIATKNRHGCLIANHGQIAFGKSLDEAMHYAQAIEKLSKQFFFCQLSKNLKLLNSKEMAEVIKKFQGYKPKH